MNISKKASFTYEVKQEYAKDLHDTYGDDVIQKKEKKVPIKIKKDNNNFVMIKQMSIQIRENLLRELGFTYFGYFVTILDTLDYNNKVDFNVLLNFGVSKQMIKMVRKKLKDTNIVKRFGNDFYINPDVARKGQNIPLYVLELYK